MDSRTRLAVGGMATVAASVAVICTVALTHSVALSHADAAAIPSAKVIVPVSPSSAPSATPAPTPTPVPSPAAEPESPPSAEVVPAPAPVVVAPSADTSSPGSAPAPGAVGDDEAIAEADRSGSWTKVREWATRWGWSPERIDAWIARLEKDRERAGHRTSGQDDDRRLADPGTGWRQDVKERPAETGANADSWPLWPGDGAKKDRSLVSPDSRDR